MAEYIDWNRELQKVILFSFKLGDVKNCIKNGADITIKDASGRTVLLNAAAKGKLDIIKYLIDEQNADILLKDYYGNSILHIAAFNGHLEIVKYLVEAKKQKIHSLNNIGNTVLHEAARGCRIDIVEYLVNERKAKINIKNHAGNTPLHELALRVHLCKNIIITDTIVYLDYHENTLPMEISKIKDVRGNIIYMRDKILVLEYKIKNKAEILKKCHKKNNPKN